MSVELLYTSAQSGLRKGSRGFCTVLQTQGIAGGLASRLESLSGYRHLFPPQHPNSGQNPIALSHIRMKSGGQAISVLSRVAPFGVDYSGRTNKLAHHLVLDPGEWPAAGPAWVLGNAGVMRTAWNGTTETPADGPAVPQHERPGDICRRWEMMTGDAGWGGVVAEKLLEPSGKPVWLIYSLDHRDSMIELIAESIALLPGEARWQATFTTYFTNLPPEAQCRLRCVVAGTEEARLAAAKGETIDLTRPLPACPSTRLTEIARRGREGSEGLPETIPPGVPDGDDSLRVWESTAAQDASSEWGVGSGANILRDPPALPSDRFEAGAKSPPPVPRSRRRLYVGLAVSSLIVLLLAVPLAFLVVSGIQIFRQTTGTAVVVQRQRQQTAEEQAERANDEDGSETASNSDSHENPGGSAEPAGEDGAPEGPASDPDEEEGSESANPDQKNDEPESTETGVEPPSQVSDRQGSSNESPRKGSARNRPDASTESQEQLTPSDATHAASAETESGVGTMASRESAAGEPNTPDLGDQQREHTLTLVFEFSSDNVQVHGDVQMPTDAKGTLKNYRWRGSKRPSPLPDRNSRLERFQLKFTDAMTSENPDLICVKAELVREDESESPVVEVSYQNEFIEEDLEDKRRSKMLRFQGELSARCAQVAIAAFKVRDSRQQIQAWAKKLDKFKANEGDQEYLAALKRMARFESSLAPEKLSDEIVKKARDLVDELNERHTEESSVKNEGNAEGGRTQSLPSYWLATKCVEDLAADLHSLCLAREHLETETVLSVGTLELFREPRVDARSSESTYRQSMLFRDGSNPDPLEPIDVNLKLEVDFSGE